MTIRRIDLAAVAFVAALGLWVAAAAGGPTANRLDAPRSATAPTLDGWIGGPEWASAGRLTIKVKQPVSGANVGDVEVELAAMHHRGRLYLAARWRDPTRSEQKEQWVRRGGQWVTDPTADEDRIAFAFPIGYVEGFEKSGCTVACHGDHMRSPAPGQRLDVWHWKSTRTAPLGYADDKWWDHTPRKIRRHGGRRGDDTGGGPAGAMRNRDGAGQPAYQPGPGAISETFLFRSAAATYDPTAPWRDGDTIAGYVLERAGGSRGDVDAVATWWQGYWQVEFARRLDTRHPDDVIFQRGGMVPFSVAVFENLAGEETRRKHGVSEGPYWLVIGR